MTSESSKLRSYGLEFINDLAKDRKVGVQSVGVSFSTYKTNLKQSNIIARVNDRKYADELLKQFQEELKKNFESQLTRITIKSLGWIKRVLTQGEKILITDEDGEEELQQTVSDLTRQMKTKSAELSRTKLKMRDLEEELKGKETTLQDLKATQQQQLIDLEQTILLEKKDAGTLSNQLEKLEEEIFAYKLELEEKMKENSSLKENNTKMNLDLVSKNSEIERLTQALGQARSSAVATDEDVTAAMEQFTVTYQQQEGHFQKTLEETKAQYDQMIKTRLKEKTDQHEKEIETLNEKLNKQESREKELQEQISELTMSEENLSNRKDHLEAVIDELTQKNDKISKKLTEQKEHYEQLQQELEEEKAKEDEKLLHLRDIQLAKTQSKAEWLEQCLSFSNFAPLTILLRMGKEMDLEALAKSVGMDPLVLENQLQALHKRDLIDISNSGVVTANIPSPDE